MTRSYTHFPVADADVRASLIASGVLRPFLGFTPTPPTGGPVLRAEIRWAHEMRFAELDDRDQSPTTCHILWTRSRRGRGR